MDSILFFQGRTLVVASQHGKEKVIAPSFEKALQLKVSRAHNLDTDALGTFSGEIDRLLSPIDAARAKCQRAMNITGFDLAIASEASFGPHPIYPFVAAHEELLLMQDRKNAWEFVVKTLETTTNYNTWTLRSLEELTDILEPAKFPSHALIVKKSAADASHCVKGIQSKELLEETVTEFLQQYSSCQVETDMRAMHNPTRMQVIARLTDQLIDQINTNCPQCNTARSFADCLVRFVTIKRAEFAQKFIPAHAVCLRSSVKKSVLPKRRTPCIVITVTLNAL
jgi:hypothetical protein